MRVLDINTNAVSAFTEQLRKMHRSALPVAIRSALNSAAFDVKQNTMPDTASATFVQRKKTFFKANSKVEAAKGFDIAAMKATVGFTGRASADKAVLELEQQESGGSIGGRSFISMNTARVSKSSRKLVRAGNRISDIGNNVIDADKVKAGSAKQKYVRAAYMAAKLYGNKGYVLGNSRGGRRTLSRIDEIWGSTKRQGLRSSRKLLIKRTPLYDYRAGRKVRVNATNFMKRASMESGLKIERYFESAAIKQFQKYLSR